MTREEIMQKSIKIIKDCAPQLMDEELKEDTVVNDDMGVDSMGFILIICKLEAEFDIRIPQKQWKKLSTLKDVIDAIELRVNAK